MRSYGLAVMLCLSSGLSGHALAASSSWVEAQGASLRLVTSGTADAEGKMRGALEIKLKPGWKTYWRDPGSSGVPPTLDISGSLNLSSADVAFPAPKRFPDEFGGWAGYDQPVSLPIVFKAGDAAKPAIIDVSVFLGVCETICVPVQAVFDVDPADTSNDADDTATVDHAFAMLPKAADPGFGVVTARVDADTLTVEAAVPGQAEAAELFVASDAGYSVGAPRREIVDGKLRFTIPLFDQPQPAPAEAGLPYTLTTPSGAVSGVLALP